MNPAFNPLVLQALLGAMVQFGLGIWLLASDHRTCAHRLAATTLFLGAAVLFFEFQSSSAISQVEAQMWARGLCLGTLASSTLFQLAWEYSDRTPRPLMTAGLHALAGALAIGVVMDPIGMGVSAQQFGIWRPITATLPPLGVASVLFVVAVTSGAVILLAENALHGRADSQAGARTLLLLAVLGFLACSLGFAIPALGAAPAPPVTAGMTTVGAAALFWGLCTGPREVRLQNACRSVLASIPLAVAIADTKGLVNTLNPAMTELTGFTTKDLGGRSMAALFDPRAGWPTGFFARWSSHAGRIHAAEGALICRDGSSVPIQLSIAPMLDGMGNTVGIVATATNIAESKRTETLLRQAKDAAEAAAKAKANFLATMSHEIRTPMNGVIGMAALLTRTRLDARQREYVDTIRGSGNALLTIIDDILNISKIEAGAVELDERPLSPGTLAQEVAELLAPRAGEKNIFLRVDLDRGLPLAVLGDVQRLRQILTNLVGNAVKFTARGEVVIRVRARTVRGGQQITFDVQDTGIGIPDNHMNRLFQSFSQVDSSISRRYGGTGLGLAISRRLADLMRGRLWAESEEGVGSTFHLEVTLPLAELPGTAEIEETQMMRSRRPLRILLAEDNRVNQLVAIRILEELGFSADVARTGTEALAMVQKNIYDVVLMDVQMPEMDGLEATRQLRTFNRHVYIIALTANAMEGDRARCMDAGMDAWLPKPITPRTLDGALGRAHCSTAPRRQVALLET